MSRTRINTDSGVVEFQDTWIDRVFDAWTEAKNENGKSERINVDTGVVEEFGGLDRWLGIWHDKR